MPTTWTGSGQDFGIYLGVSQASGLKSPDLLIYHAGLTTFDGMILQVLQIHLSLYLVTVHERMQQSFTRFQIECGQLYICRSASSGKDGFHFPYPCSCAWLPFEDPKLVGTSNPSIPNIWKEHVPTHQPHDSAPQPNRNTPSKSGKKPNIDRYIIKTIWKPNIIQHQNH